MAKIDLKSPGSIPNYTLKKNLQLGDNYISNDGVDEGIKAKDTGEITINPSNTGALTFDAANEHLKITDFFDFKSITAFTVSLWHYNNDDSATERILWKYHVDSDNYIQLKLAAGRQIRLDWVGTGTQGWANAPATFVTNTNLYMDTSSNQTGFVNYWDHWAVAYDASQTQEYSMQGNATNKFYFNVVSPTDSTTANGKISWASGTSDLLTSYFFVGDIVQISGTTSATNDGVYTITALADYSITVSSDGGTTNHSFSSANLTSGYDDASANILIASEPKIVKIYKNGTLLTKATNHNLTWSHHDAFNSQYASLAFNTNTITRSSGTPFIEAGFTVGMKITISGATDAGNNEDFIINRVTDTILYIVNNASYSFTNALTPRDPDNGAGGGNITLSVSASEKLVGSYPSGGGASSGYGFGDAFPPSTMAGDGDLYIGYTETSLLGKLGEAAIWSVPLSSDNIAQLYDNGSPYDASSIEKDSLLGYWKMTEINASNKVPNSINPGINDFTAVDAPTVSTAHVLPGSTLGISSESTRSIRSPFYVQTNYITHDSGILLQSKNQDGTGGVFISSEGKVSMMDKSRAVYLKHPQGPSCKSWFNCGNIGDLNSANNWSISGWYNTPFNTIKVGLFSMNGYEAGGHSHIGARITTSAKLQVWFYDLINSKEALFNEDVGNAKANQWHHYVFTYDNSKKAYIQSTGISVAQDGSSVDSLNISSGFTSAGFITVGMKIKVSGFTTNSAQNNGTFTVKSVSDTKIELDETTLLAENAGDTVTIESWGYEMFKAYRDGVEIVGTFDGHGSGSRLPLQSAPMAIGNSVVYNIGQRNLNGFYGLVGEHALWVSNAANSDATLTQAEVTKLYDNGFVYAANGVKIDFLIGYWKMVAKQASSMGADGLFESTSFYSFDGSDDFIGGFDDEEFNISSEASVSGWVKFDAISSTNHHIISKFKSGGGASARQWDLLIANGVPKFNVQDEGGDSGSDYMAIWGSALEVGQWYHIVATFKTGEHTRIYVNGVTQDSYKSSSVLAGDPDNTVSKVFIGKNEDAGSGNFLNGDLRHVSVWNKQLTEADVSNLYQTGSSSEGTPADLQDSNIYDSDGANKAGTNLQAWWKLDGNTTDEKGNHNGTADGAASVSSASYSEVAADTWIPSDSNIYKDVQIPAGTGNYGGQAYRVENHMGNPDYHAYINSTSGGQTILFKNVDGLSCASVQMTNDGFDLLRGKLALHGNLFDQEGFVGGGANTYSTSLQMQAPPTTTTQSNSGQLINFSQKAITASGFTTTNIGLKAVMTSASPTVAGTVVNQGIKLDITSGTSGTQTSKGLVVNTSGGSSSGANNIGVEVTQTTGTHIKCLYDATNYMTLSTGANGATTLTTVDASSGTAANLILNVSGDVDLQAEGGDITFKGASDAALATISSSGLTLNNITQVGSDTDKFLMSDSGVVKYVTGANLKSYIGVTTISNYVTNDADDTMAGTLTIDKDTSFTTSTTSSGIHIDLDHTGIMGGSQTGTFIGANIDINTDSPSHHAYSTIDSYGLDIALTTNTDGSANKNTGINILCTGGDASHAYGIKSNVTDGGTDIALYSSADTGDYCTIATTTHGATTITTVDDDDAAANLTFTIDGAIALNGTNMSVGSNVDFRDFDITNVDSLDADKFSIAGGTEMTGIGGLISDNSATNIATARTVKTYVDANAGGSAKETFSFMKRFTCNSSTSKWVGGYRDNYYKSAEVWSLNTTKDVGGNYTDTTVSMWSSFVYSDFTVANACTITKFTCSGYQNNADEDIVIGLWKITPRGDASHSGTWSCAHIGWILFEANADTTSMHATQTLTSFQGTTSLAAGDCIMVCGTDPGTGGTDGTYWWLNGAIEVTYD